MAAAGDLATSALALSGSGQTLGGSPYVLVVEGSIQTGAPDGGSAGDYCHIANFIPGISESPVKMSTAVNYFADRGQCVYVLAVGTCAAFGGIPAGDPILQAQKAC
jgi:Ni,Fe-hydrogenase I small subunit